MEVSQATRMVEEGLRVAFSYATEQERELLQDVDKKLKENKFNLVVLGQFKRGKTTFVNALLGEKLLPSAVLPLTSIVTVVEYGVDKKVEVYFLNGEKKEISPDEIKLYVTEKENPKNVKQVKYVRVFHPAEILKKGIILVDTPGVGSVYENNTEVTYDFLPRVDAALFLLTVDPPLSKEETEFLKNVAPHVARLFFILNKADYISPEDLEDVLSFVRDNLKNLTGQEHKIYPISAKMALEGRVTGDSQLVEKSGILELERDLEDFILKERSLVVLRSSANKVLSVLSTHLFQADLELKMATTPVEELEKKIERFRQLKESVHQEARDSEFLFRGEIESLIKLVNMDVERFRKQKVPQIFERLMEVFEKNKHRSALELSRILDDAMKKLLVEELDRFVEEENEKVNKEYARIARRFSDKINSIIDELLKLAADIFEVKLERFKVEEEITQESELWYKLEDPPRLLDVAESIGKVVSYTFLPSAIVHRKIKSELSKKLPEKVDMNCGRVRSDFVDRINKSAIELRWGMQEKIKETLKFVEEAVERAISMREKSKEEVDKYMAQITSRKRELEEHVNRLKKILAA